MTFNVGEATLSEWMHLNASVAWFVTDEPEAVEAYLIHNVSLPLNLDQNNHPFKPALAAMRAAARMQARELPVYC
jgi:hypothetical protein